MKTNKNLLKEISKVIELEDNSCLVDLYGEHDENLSKLENNFGIHISYRGNILEFRGESEPCLEASQLVLKVYKKLLSGEKINSEMFDNFSKKDILASAERLNTILIKTKKKNIYSRSSNQSKFVELIKSKDLVFGVGPAGTGKTYLAVACAVESLLKKDINKIILSRPAVEAGERLGFLPGDLKEKIDPYLRPLYDSLYDLFDFEKIQRMIEIGDIEIAPLAFMRGRTLKNSFAILDESQNATDTQIKMFLTRIGENSKIVINGDPTQIDLPNKNMSGLVRSKELLGHLNEISVVDFDHTDVVRHPLVSKIVKAYSNND